MGKEITRRGFIAGMGAAGTALVAGGLCSTALADSGSGSATSASAPASVLASASAASSTAASSSKSDSQPTSTSAIEEVVDDQVSATEEADIVVAGSGSAGTYAAIRAAEMGAKVIWLEKNEFKGGTSFVTEGLRAMNGAAQLEADGETDLIADYALMQNWHNWGAHGPAILSYLENSGRAVDWAIGHGARLVYVGTADAPMYTCLDDNGGWINMGTGMLTPLFDYGDTLSNLEYRGESPVINLVYDGGKVAGVYTKDTTGSITRINAKAVILATGGFGKNPAMCAERLRVPAERVEFLGLDGQSGDGIDLALAAGAASHAPTSVMFGLTKVEGDTWDGMMTIFTQWAPSWRAPQEVGRGLPMVDQNGKRFFNENLLEEFDTSKINVAVASQPCVYTIFDEKHVETYSGFDEFDYGSGIAHGDFRECIEASSAVVKADTLEELAGLIGVDPEAFVATLEDWNARANGDGSVDSLGNVAENMTPIENAPFYAAHIVSCAYSTCGGVKASYNMEAIDKNDQVIPGLYVAGLDNGSMYYNDYPYGIHGGSGQANSCTTGFMAGESAAKALGFKE